MNITPGGNFSQRPNGPSPSTGEQRKVEELTRSAAAPTIDPQHAEKEHKTQTVGGSEDKPRSDNSGKESSTDKELKLSEQDRRDIERLANRDREVRAHEAAHVSAAGNLAKGGASFEYTKGPDGKQYATSGEVGIDSSKASSPDATLIKAQRVKAAALAPSTPSAQDRRVAAQAAQLETEARAEINRLQRAEQKAEQEVKEVEASELDSRENVSASSAVPQESAKTSDTEASKAAELKASDRKDEVIAVNSRAQEYEDTNAAPGGAGRIFNLVA